MELESVGKKTRTGTRVDEQIGTGVDKQNWKPAGKQNRKLTSKQNWKPVGNKTGNRLEANWKLELAGKQTGTETGKQTGTGRRWIRRSGGTGHWTRKPK